MLNDPEQIFYERITELSSIVQQSRFELGQGLVLVCQVDDELCQVLVVHAVVIVQLSADLGDQGQVLQSPQLVHFHNILSLTGK